MELAIHIQYFSCIICHCLNNSHESHNDNNANISENEIHTLEMVMAQVPELNAINSQLPRFMPFIILVVDAKTGLIKLSWMSELWILNLISRDEGIQLKL